MWYGRHILPSMECLCVIWEFKLLKFQVWGCGRFRSVPRGAPHGSLRAGASRVRGEALSTLGVKSFREGLER